MASPFLAEIRMFSGNFAPRGWAFCNGQLLPIQQNTALFSLLGTTYGGNGTTTFALPDLRGRAPLSAGLSTTGRVYTLGERSGAETVTLLTSNLPAHNHTLAVNTGLGNSASPQGNFPAELADPNTGSPMNLYATASNATANAGAVGAAGSNVPVSIMQPYLCVEFIIATQGIFPSRN